MTTVLDALVAARAVIEDPANWTRGTLARTKNGVPTLATDPNACCFCAYGAVAKVLGQQDGNLYKDTMNALNISGQRCFRTDYVASIVNDTLGHEAVLKVYDDAIGLASAG